MKHEKWTMHIRGEAEALLPILEELSMLFRRGRLSAKQIGELINLFNSPQEAFSTVCRNRVDDATLRTSVTTVFFEPSDRLINLLAAFRAGPPKRRLTRDSHNVLP